MLRLAYWCANMLRCAMSLVAGPKEVSKEVTTLGGLLPRSAFVRVADGTGLAAAARQVLTKNCLRPAATIRHALFGQLQSSHGARAALSQTICVGWSCPVAVDPRQCVHKCVKALLQLW